MKVSYKSCDNCGANTDASNPNWFSLDRLGPLHFMRDSRIDLGEHRDFCSWKCVGEYGTKRERSEARSEGKGEAS